MYPSLPTDVFINGCASLANLVSILWQKFSKITIIHGFLSRRYLDRCRIRPTHECMYKNDNANQEKLSKYL